jgi:putative ABC transport system permease protein
VLLLACANIAGLLLARGAARQAEIAVRVALGASTGRLVRQLFTESALLAITGGALGFALSWALIRFAPRFIPPSAIPAGALELSSSAIWFTLAASALTCVLVGLAPALGLASPQQTLRQSGRGTTAGRSSQRVRQTIVATEVAAALILFAGAWLMAASLRNLARTNPGFDPAHVFTVHLFLPASRYDVQQTLRFCRQAQERMAALPGVESVAVATALPLLNNFEVRFDRDGSPRPEAERPSAPYAAVAPAYFSTLRISLLRGRYFAASDDERAPLVAVISKELAARFFPNEDPLGKKLEVSRPVPLQNSEETVRPRIVGVVDNVKDTDLAGDPRPMVYVPYAQNPFLRGVWFVARVAGAPISIAFAARREFASIDPEQPVEQVGALEDTVAGQLAQPRFETSLMSGFAAVSLLLAMLGVYGVNAYAVVRRRNELGLRMALGATRGEVLRMVIRQGMIPTGIGILLGIAGAVAGASLLRSVLVGAERLDMVAFVGAALVLSLVSIIACAIPAWRATRIDPAITLRAE